jgi:hypothetical protein
METKKSKFDPSHTLVFLQKTDKEYVKFKDKFSKHGLAFKHARYIFFDVPELKKSGYYTKEHLTFIEAHEVAHSVLRHTKTSKYTEAEADFLAVLLCDDAGFNKSARLGKREFSSRNGISFNAFQKKHQDSVLKKIKR